MTSQEKAFKDNNCIRGEYKYGNFSDDDNRYKEHQSDDDSTCGVDDHYDNVCDQIMPMLKDLITMEMLLLAIIMVLVLMGM